MGMGAQAPKAAGSKASWTPNDTFAPLSAPGVEGTSSSATTSASTRYRNIRHSEAVSQEGTCASQRSRTGEGGYRPSHASLGTVKDLPDQLYDLLIDWMGHRGAELGDAFLSAAELPPVTRQSLSELDLDSLLINSRLRHDCNFDRDLSFRPNLDGPRGQEKQRQSQKYWLALVAELEIYTRLFQGSQSPWTSNHSDWSVLIQFAKRRIPKMFETVRDVLMTLVPERDQAGVSEHLDLEKLMQEIQRGVCDLVKLAEWLAHLLKQHCAPIRDCLIDRMVEITRRGVAENNCDLIIRGLTELFGILEAMKLDIANHQVKNLKSWLIEDTINFEQQYHQHRLERGYPKANIQAAQNWWTTKAAEFRPQCLPTPWVGPRAKFEVLVRAVTRSLFSTSGSDLPDTFYLDSDRIRVLGSDVRDVVYFEICFDFFEQLLKDFGHHGPVWQSTRDKLRSAISDTIGNAAAQGPHAWMLNSEAISLQIYHQALTVACRPPVYSADVLESLNERLRARFDVTSPQYAVPKYAVELEALLLQQILSCSNKYYNSSPIDLFNNLVPAAPLAPSLAPLASSVSIPDTFALLSSDRLTNISNRITHILLLHWKIWGDVYFQEEAATKAFPPQSLALTQPQAQSPTPPPRAPSPPQRSASSACSEPPSPQPLHKTEADVQVPDAMKMGKPPEPGSA